MGWRPEKEWIKQRSIFFEQHQPLKPYYKTRQIDYEAGADAILGALRKNGFKASSIRDIKCPESETITIPTLERMKELKEVKGTWVFIPNEEQNGKTQK